MTVPLRSISILCHDGFRLTGHHWSPPGRFGTVIVNPATGVAARYYHAYARFLAEQGFAVLTYDYRGIGLSRPARLRGLKSSWRDWGELDFDAAIRWAHERNPAGPLVVVGHSIGGFLPGFAASAPLVDRFLAVGGQYAYWRDYRADRRLGLFVKWHLLMPFLTAACGYFPGKRLGWLEDLPAGVAHEWSFRRARLEASYPAPDRPAILARFAAVRAPILAVAMSDDEYATPAALHRGLSYYTGSDRLQLHLTPAELGLEEVGHFDLFRRRHRDGFWRQSCLWLRDGINPWPAARTLPGEGKIGR